MSDWTNLEVGPKDAAKQLRKLTARKKGERARSVFLSVRQDAPITDKPGHIFPILGSVKVTRAVAERFIADNYMNFEKRGALVKFSWCDTCLFVG